MEVSVKCTAAGDLVFIQVDERLDFSVNRGFNRAMELARSAGACAIVVDLARTKKLFDSGKAMLLRLHAGAGGLKDRIHLVNAAPRIGSQLSQGAFATMFSRGGELRQ